MSPMETMAISMLGKMTGLTPEQMQEFAAKGMHLLQTIEGRMAAIEKNVIEIKDMLDIDMPDLDHINEKVAETHLMLVHQKEALNGK